MPKPKEMEKLAREFGRRTSREVLSVDVDEGWWQSVLSDPRAVTPRPAPARTLSEIRSDLLRVECLRCFRIVEIKRMDAIKLYGLHAVWKDVGNRLLDDGCQHRTGRHEEDGCWPDFR